MKTGNKVYKLTGAQITAALNGGISLLIPWPSDIVGEYGSGEFDGSPVSPESCDRVMDTYVSNVLESQVPGGRMKLEGNPDLVVHSVIAGRAKSRDALVPCISVRIGVETQYTGFRETWVHA